MKFEVSFKTGGGKQTTTIGRAHTVRILDDRVSIYQSGKMGQHGPMVLDRKNIIALFVDNKKIEI